MMQKLRTTSGPFLFQATAIFLGWLVLTFFIPPPSVAAQSRTAEQWAVMAAEAARQGQHRRAVTLYSRAIKLKPDYLAALYNRGLSYLILSQNRAAAKDFQQCLKLRPGWSDAKYNLYVALKRLGRAKPGLIVAADPARRQARWRRLVEQATQKLRVDPTNVPALIQRGRALTKLGRHKWAQRDFDRALSLKPKSVPALLARGEFLLRVRKPKSALVDLDRVVKLDPKRAEAYLWRGRAQVQLGDLDKALADYSRAVTLDPKLTDAYRDRAVVYRYLEKWAPAVADASRVIKTNPEDVEMYALRSAGYAALGKPKLSLADLSRIIQLRPRFPATYAVRAWLWRALGRPRLAAMDLAMFRHLAGRKRTAAMVVVYAKSFIGLPYLFGGSSASRGFDCSGLMKHIFGLFGIKLPRHSSRQFEAGRPVARDKLQAGDLVFFQSARTGWHVGLYIGANQFLHATARGHQVRVDSLSTKFYHRHFRGGRRVLK